MRSLLGAYLRLSRINFNEELPNILSVPKKPMPSMFAIFGEQENQR